MCNKIITMVFTNLYQKIRHLYQKIYIYERSKYPVLNFVIPLKKLVLIFFKKSLISMYK